MFIPLALIQDARPAVVATLPATNLLAEDLAFDAASGRWFVSSVHRREILVKAPGRPWRVFVSRGLSGVLALGLNAPRRCLWATSVGLPQASDLMAVDRDRSALVAFVTDSRGGGVYRLDPGGKALASLVAPGTFRSPQTPVVVEGGILVPDYAKGLAFVPASGGAARWLEFPAGADLRGLDGMALAGHRLYAVQNGASPNRVLALDLDAGFAKVERVTVLMEVSEATHVLLHGGALFLLADNGWDRFGPDGALVKDLPPETPPRILKLPLP